MIAFSSADIRMWSRLGPSGAFGAAAMELAETHPEMVMLSADMSFASGIDRFRNKYPERHFETGIAEQNLVSMAAGMAREGLLPYATTYATFLSTRASDQVKMCLGYMKQNVKLVGVLAGFGAGILGPTHMGLEDIAVMRTIPNITVLSPADGLAMVKAFLMAAEIPGPVYIRLTGGMNLPIVYRQDREFIPGKAIQLREGKDVTLVATGSMLYYALAAADVLAVSGIHCSVLDMHTIKPLDEDALAKAASTELIVTLEEHSRIGGLGGAVAEFISDSASLPLLRIGVPDSYPHAGSYPLLMSQCDLTAEQIALAVSTKLHN